MSTIRNYARLFRIPNLPTCIVDVVGGFFLASNYDATEFFGSGLLAPYASLGLLVIASMLLYCGGMADNDVQHVDKDHVLKAKRPIPEGKISLTRASWVAGWLMVLGVILASIAPRIWSLVDENTGLILGTAILIVICSKWYNYLAAGHTVEFTYYPPSLGANIGGVILLAMARVLNVSLGYFLGSPLYSSSGGGVDWFELSIIASFIFIYFMIVIVASLFEDSGAKRKVAVVLAALMLLLTAWVLIAAPLGVVAKSGWIIKYRAGEYDGLSLWLQPAILVFLSLMAVALSLVLSKCWWAFREPTPRNMGMIVKWGIAGDCLLMGALASITHVNNAPLGLGLAALIFLCAWLGRFAHAT